MSDEGRTLIFDAETDGLLFALTKFHCIGIEDVETAETWLFDERQGNLEEGLRMLEKADVLIGHNIMGFDLPAIEKIYPWFETEAKIRDTLIMSRLFWADRDKLDNKLVAADILEGKYYATHGLAGWGQRLGYPKGDFSDWCLARDIDPWGDWGWEGEHTFVDADGIVEVIPHSVIYEMRNDYCRQDVEVTSKLSDHILTTMDRWDQGDWPVWLEHRFEEIMQGVKSDGFHIDVPKTQKLHDEIVVYLEDFHAQCAEAFPPAWVPVKDGMTRADFWAMVMVLVDKQDKRVDKAEAAGKTIKVIYDYEDLCLDMYNSIPEHGSVGWVKIAARTSKSKVKGTDHVFVCEAGSCKTPAEFKAFNPNSRLQIVDKLMELGWEPEKFTPAGNPSTEGDILQEAAQDIPVALPIAGGLKCTKIKGYLKSKPEAKDKKGWLDIVSAQGRIHARIVHIGAVTHRVALSRPNIGQIPSVTHAKDENGVEQVVLGFEGGWGWECRDVFVPPKTWLMMGCDLAGIEIRLFAEEMREFDGGAYAEVVLDGDIHTKNQEAAGLATRSFAKTFLYSVLYGVGGLKLGKSLTTGAISDMAAKKVGNDSKKKFFKAIPAAKKVIKKYEKEAKNGYIIAIDGRRVPCDSGHKALNSRLQNAGALIAKLWTIMFYDAMLDAGYEPGYNGDFVIVAFVHDELQTCCRTEEIAHAAGKIAEETALLAGQHFGIEIPTAAEYKVGNSWAETH